MAWFTTKKGKHINTEWFLKEEQIKQNKEIADRLNAAGGSIKGNKPQAIKGSPASIKVSGNLAKRGISNANDIEKHLRGLSSTRRNRLAKELGIEGRGEEKLKAMVSDLSSAGKPGSAIPGSQARGIVKKTTAPEYERTPKMDWIDKRIEGKQAELNKLNKKMERIEAAKASNWEKNPYYYDEYDIVSTQKDIDSVKVDIEKYKQDMETEIGKARSRNVPAITNFLNDWHDKTIEFYTNRKAEFDKAVTERNAKNTEYSRWYYSLEASKLKNEDLDAYKARTKAYKEYNKEFDEEWRDVTQFFGGSGTWENNMRKAVAQEKNRKYDDIISRTNELIGEITDAGGLSVGKSGDLNGVIVGKNGRVNLETIGAGGYNIQRYHFRTLIHKLADAPKPSGPINAVGMDVNQLAEEITFKNIDEKLGLKTTDAQKLSLLGVFSAMKDLFHSYDANRTPREIFRFEVNQPLINDELIPDNYVRVFIGVKGKTGNEFMDSLDTDYASVSIGKSGGFFTYNRNRKKVYFKTATSAVIGLKEDK